MKKILFILSVFIGAVSCENFDVEHPDFEHTSGFFPYQYPIRTLVLGDYIYDNANDNAHKFVISVAMGGVYENTRDRKFTIEVDENLCNDIKFSILGDGIKAMPRSWYTLSSNNEIVIPSGKFNGGVEVQLNDAFFEDPVAIKLGYVIPIRLKASADVDSILSGYTITPGSDPRIASDWVSPPKNFTMFAVKYINEYHGVYFRYGTSQLKNAANEVLRDSAYNKKSYVEYYPTSKLTTTARKQVSFSATFAARETTDPMIGDFNMLLNFDSNNNCTISAPDGSPYTISGTGQFKTNAYAWGNKERNGIVLNYTVKDAANNTYTASDVLVVRDRAVVMEVYTPVLK